jgi:DEAD/DEAH box helicase domain-containing protein
MVIAAVDVYSMDTLVFDIETQNFFTSPDVGRENFGALKISVVCAYSYHEERYFSFTENEMPATADLFARAGRLVGFSSNRYDIPVLNQYFSRLHLPIENLWKKERVDLLEEIELATGERVSLSRLAEANLGEKKEQHGAQAIDLYREGKMDELIAYCMNDVRLTKGIYDLYLKRHYLMVPSKKTGKIVRVTFAKQSIGTDPEP